MSIDLSSATAIVKFMGLGIICFNEKMKRCETLLIHNDNHKPSLSVTIESNNQTDSILELESLEDNFFKTLKDLAGLGETKVGNISIEISGVGNCEMEGFKKYANSDFDRKKLIDENDYGYVVNMERDKLIGSKSPKRMLGKDHTGLTNLFISNAEFFTYDLVRPYDGTTVRKEGNKPQYFYKTKFIIESESENTTIKKIDYKDYGYVADYVGAKINSDFVQIKIKIDGIEHIKLLPKKTTPYIIEINNATADSLSDSDMPIYQQFWGVSDSKTTDLLIQSELEKEHKDAGLKYKRPKGGHSIGVRRTCFLVESDAEGLDIFEVN